VVLVACATESRAIHDCGQPAYTVDVSIAFAYMILQACDLVLEPAGLAHSKKTRSRRSCDPQTCPCLAISPLGYPTHKARETRKDLAEIVCFESMRRT